MAKDIGYATGLGTRVVGNQITLVVPGADAKKIGKIIDDVLVPIRNDEHIPKELFGFSQKKDGGMGQFEFHDNEILVHLDPKKAEGILWVMEKKKDMIQSKVDDIMKDKQASTWLNLDHVKSLAANLGDKLHHVNEATMPLAGRGLSQKTYLS